MISLAETIGALTLLFPLGGMSADAPASAPVSQAVEPAQAGETPKLPNEVQYPVFSQSTPIASLKVTYNQSQIRIERRVYVRIAPRSVAARRNMLAQLPVRSAPRRYKEQKAEKCVAVEQIAGVETGSGNRLLLFLRDAEILSVNLEKACRARDFYSGFYVERNEDGKLCVQRDTLQSRNGARCDIARMMQLKAVED
ncbi:MAG: hypothetical protein AAF251_16390 [Pseudomonadota bacterium]